MFIQDKRNSTITSSFGINKHLFIDGHSKERSNKQYFLKSQTLFLVIKGNIFQGEGGGLVARGL